MTASDVFQLALGIAAGALAVPLVVLLVKLLRVEVEDEEAVLVTRFGKLVATLDRPGWHWFPSRILPWVGTKHVSLRRDFLEIEAIQVNDARGTTLVVDVFLELRIRDPRKATYAVADWERSVRNLVSHAVISILGNREFQAILGDRTELGELLQHDVSAEVARWGIEIELVFLKNVSLLPEVAQQVFGTIAARLERATAAIEEEGRQKVALLEAETSARMSALVAEAKGQYPRAVGQAYEALGRKPGVLAAYEELYRLAQLRPHRTTAFEGFAPGELRAIDTAMIPTTAPDGAGVGELASSGKSANGGS